jgi:hypothetical protein
MYVTTCSETFPFSPKGCPRLRTAYRKRGDFIVKNFVIVTPAHPQVPPRNWAIHAPKDMGKCGDLDSSVHEARKRDPITLACVGDYG